MHVLKEVVCVFMFASNNHHISYAAPKRLEITLVSFNFQP